MIKYLIMSILVAGAYKYVLDGDLLNTKKETIEIDLEQIEPEGQVSKIESDYGSVGDEVQDLQRYRSEMLQQVNKINSMIKNVTTMESVKKIISDNADLDKIKNVVNNNQLKEIKSFLTKFGTKNTSFLKANEVLNEKDSQHFEVTKPMTLEEYKKKSKQDF